MRRFRDSQLVIITNIVVVSSVGIKRVICICISFLFRHYSDFQFYEESMNLFPYLPKVL